MQKESPTQDNVSCVTDELPPPDSKTKDQAHNETGGVKGPEPTRYGDWEKNGRCVDF
jgi:hypothetical protein